MSRWPKEALFLRAYIGSEEAIYEMNECSYFQGWVQVWDPRQGLQQALYSPHAHPCTAECRAALAIARARQP